MSDGVNPAGSITANMTTYTKIAKRMLTRPMQPTPTPSPTMMLWQATYATGSQSYDETITMPNGVSSRNSIPYDIRVPLALPTLLMESNPKLESLKQSTGRVHVASAFGVYADWLLRDSGPAPEHCGAWQVGTLDSPKGDIAPAMPAVWRYQIYPRKEK